MFAALKPYLSFWLAAVAATHFLGPPETAYFSGDSTLNTTAAWVWRVYAAALLVQIGDTLFGRMFDRWMVNSGRNPVFHVNNWLYDITDQKWVEYPSETDADNQWEFNTQTTMFGADAIAYMSWKSNRGKTFEKLYSKRLMKRAKAMSAERNVAFVSLPMTLDPSTVTPAKKNTKKKEVSTAPSPTTSNGETTRVVMDTLLGAKLTDDFRGAIAHVEVARTRAAETQFSEICAATRSFVDRLARVQCHSSTDDAENSALRTRISRSDMSRTAKDAPPVDTPLAVHLVDPAVFTPTFSMIRDRLDAAGYSAHAKEWVGNAGVDAVVAALPVARSIVYRTLIDALERNTPPLKRRLVIGDGGEDNFKIYILVDVS